MEMRTHKRQALFWAAFFLGLVGFVLHSQQLFIMAAAAALLWPVSALLGRGKLAGLSVSRSAPPMLQAGESGTVTLQLCNQGRTRRLFVHVVDSLPEKAGSKYVRLTVPAVSPDEQLRLSYTLQTSLRGIYRLGPLTLEADDTLGLSTFVRHFEQFDEIVVCPTPLPLPSLWPADAAGRERRKPRRIAGADGLDFLSIREYVPGDEPRRIHWPTTARMDELMTIQFAREEGLDGVIIIDLQESSHGGEGLYSTLEQGVILAASAARQVELGGGRAALVAVGAADYSVPLAFGPGQYRHLLEALARVELTETDNWTDVVSEGIKQMPPRCPAIVISPRTDDVAITVARHLLARHLVVSWIVLQQTDTANLSGVGQLQALGCRVRVVNCSLPLQAQFGTGYRVHAGV
jgi:uncharacterized protein (DUF58 family)